MGFDEELSQLRREREQIEADFDDVRRAHQRKEEQLNDTFSILQDILYNNRERMDEAVRGFTRNDDSLRRTYEQYQAHRDQVRRFIAKKGDELDEEYSRQKKLYHQQLDENESNYTSLLRKEK